MLIRFRLNTIKLFLSCSLFLSSVLSSFGNLEQRCRDRYRYWCVAVAFVFVVIVADDDDDVVALTAAALSKWHFATTAGTLRTWLYAMRTQCVMHVVRVLPFLLVFCSYCCSIVLCFFLFFFAIFFLHFIVDVEVEHCHGKVNYSGWILESMNEPSEVYTYALLHVLACLHACFFVFSRVVAPIPSHRIALQ